MTGRISSYQLGREAEERAARWLERRGFSVVARNVRNHGGEIDVVARDEDTLCFVEVKARTTATCGRGAASVTPARQRRLGRAASLEIVRAGWKGPCRFDVLEMRCVDGEWRFFHLPNAFEVGGG